MKPPRHNSYREATLVCYLIYNMDADSGMVVETEEMRIEGLRNLRELMLKSEDTVRYPRNDDKFLLAFLRCKKYRLEDAHKVLVNFSNFWYSPSKEDMINGLCAEKVRGIYEMGKTLSLSVSQSFSLSLSLSLTHKQPACFLSIIYEMV